jgi:Na+/melibiose symporter-like transporter|tara:strand:- start:962 stop:1198 length:237 start_codon:yes stop_codon:yes gene_type:complete
MNKKLNKRIFKPKTNISSDLSYNELRKLLKEEQRKENKEAIKEIISNKIFAKVVFTICIFLNLLFLTLGSLNYFNIIG